MPAKQTQCLHRRRARGNMSMLYVSFTTYARPTVRCSKTLGLKTRRSQMTPELLALETQVLAGKMCAEHWQNTSTTVTSVETNHSPLSWVDGVGDLDAHRVP